MTSIGHQRRNSRMERFLPALLIFLFLAPRTQPDPLPSWNDGPCKRAILDFVSRVTTPGTPSFVPQPERIATFDNDGTLWTEQPVYTQMAFVLDRVKALAPQHPEWKQQQPFKAILQGDLKTLAASGEKGMMQVVMATHTGMTTQDFEVTVKDWISTAKHPRFHRPYTECVYQPMLELMAFLRANGFKTYITSGGGVEFHAALDRAGVRHSS